ncbi:hypothetical protein A2U01_0087437, partial [Trifolium medium]|nr:hypothetical protein [Trifolium medium]
GQCRRGRKARNCRARTKTNRHEYWRPGDFYVPEDVSAEFSALSRWENFPHAMVISGGGFNKINIGSVKRKFDELIGESSNMSAT